MGLKLRSACEVPDYRGAIVFLSGDPELMNAAMEAGGSAFVTKRRLTKNLLVAIREALAGHTFVSFLP